LPGPANREAGLARLAATGSGTGVAMGGAVGLGDGDGVGEAAGRVGANVEVAVTDGWAVGVGVSA